MNRLGVVSGLAAVSLRPAAARAALRSAASSSVAVVSLAGAATRACRPAPASAARTLSSRTLSARISARSEEHTSELQSQSNLVCRLLLENKKYQQHRN